eukprot:TRINITY_DN5088_c0_g1_i2.p3 TRINITY_DN5088_c0_g1~~TRINITY_DN5088_c0_g1_i2.p3  ORF type:complete len:109 (+),score=56.93 TRINITY_DN5088_c0_g1_i2:44-328(+)
MKGNGKGKGGPAPPPPPPVKKGEEVEGNWETEMKGNGKGKGGPAPPPPPPVKKGEEVVKGENALKNIRGFNRNNLKKLEDDLRGDVPQLSAKPG